MTPTRPPRTENSAAGLVLLDGGHVVVVTGEEGYQGVLSRFAPRPGDPARQWAAALCPAPIQRGRHAGQRGIDVLLDGERVGELTHRMAQRYLVLVDDVLRSGGRPGCLARVVRDRRGLQVELRLPAVTDRVGAAAATEPAGRLRKPLWIGVGAAGALLIIGVSIGGTGSSPRAAPSVSAAAVSSSPTSTSTPTPTPSATSVPAAVVPTVEYRAPSRTTVAVPAPPPTRASTARTTRARSTAAAAQQAEPTQPKPATKASAKPSAGCDSNYSGCVPIASDVDCAGGSGNGPKYVSGPLRVTGTDVYGLDNDKDGTACE